MPDMNTLAAIATIITLVVGGCTIVVYVYRGVRAALAYLGWGRGAVIGLGAASLAALILAGVGYDIFQRINQLVAAVQYSGRVLDDHEERLCSIEEGLGMERHDMCLREGSPD